MNKWTNLPSKETVEKVMKQLKKNNINAIYAENAEEAKAKVLEIISKDARVFAGQSKTLDQINLSEAIENSNNMISVRKEYMSLDYEKEKDKIRMLRSTPDVIVGSVHAITKDGVVLIASNTGSQLASYASSAGKVIWVVGTQKIVDNQKEGFKRIYDFVLPLESERLKKLYGVPSNVSKLLIVNKEVDPNRITLVFVNEVLGF